MSVSALKRARHFTISWARRGKNLLSFSGILLMSHRGSFSCGLPRSKGTFVTSFIQPARSCTRVAHSERVSGDSIRHQTPDCEWSSLRRCIQQWQVPYTALSFPKKKAPGSSSLFVVKSSMKDAKHFPSTGLEPVSTG